MHAFIEFSQESSPPFFTNPMKFWSITEGSFIVGRDYDVFDALGDGRNYHFLNEPNRELKRAFYPPRGLPEYLSHAVEHAFYPIIDEQGILGETRWKTVTGQQADIWINTRGSYLYPRAYRAWNGSKTVELQRVSYPYWHTPSWLTLPEIHVALEAHGIQVATTNIYFRLMLGTMEKLEAEAGNGRTRLVFWFDS